MRHATATATRAIFDWAPWAPLSASNNRRACDWTHSADCADEKWFDFWTSEQLIAGREVALPTCPACAALLDLALELRGA